MFFYPNKEVLEERTKLLADIQSLRKKQISNRDLLNELEELGWKDFAHMFESYIDFCLFLGIKESEYSGLKWRS